MADPVPVSAEQERVFRIHPSAASSGLWSLVVGIALIVLGIAGALVSMFVSPRGPVFLQLTSTLPMLLGIGCLLSARMVRRTPQEVAVSANGIRITYRHKMQTYEWRQIGCALTQDGGMNGRRYLSLCDPAGRAMAKIGDAIVDFDAMRALIESRIIATDVDTSERLRMAKSRRMALCGVGLGAFLLLAGGSVAWTTREDIRAENLLQESAVLGNAEIQDHFLAPNGVTPRLVYQITTPDGRTATRNVEVDRVLWDQLGEMKMVPVLYVADEPSISRLLLGEVERSSDRPGPAAGYGMAILAFCMSVACFAGAGILWHGLDLGKDPVTGRFSIRRYGVSR